MPSTVLLSLAVRPEARSELARTWRSLTVDDELAHQDAVALAVRFVNAAAEWTQARTAQPPSPDSRPTRPASDAHATTRPITAEPGPS